ncbi:MAG: aminodeoxychorismate synthase component I [Acidaminobacteraceae bacterium]
MIIREIKTSLNSFEIYLAFKDDEYSYFLDSGMNNGGLGKYSFVGSNPFKVFKSKNGEIEVVTGSESDKKTGNPFKELKDLYLKYQMDYKIDLPFIGGMVGYFAYDLCHHVEKIARTAVDDVNIPDLYLGFYDGAIVIDHENNKVYATDAGIRPGGEARILCLEDHIRVFENNPVVLNIPRHDTEAVFTSNFEKEEFKSSITKVREFIRSGDIYQANMTQRFTTPLRDNPLHLYKKLRDINPAPFASFMDFGEGHIVSSSPERFLSLRDGVIETRPIKGTLPRGKNDEEDAINRELLQNSEKDRSELLMIVDLERNDLSKIAKVASVVVPEHFAIETYATVFHLVSTVRAQVLDGLTPIDCIEATFPGGSITGAPKIRAMEVIDELEPTQRNLYTGSIGYIGFNGEMDLNIVIRTILCKEDTAYFQVGGGIVWDSKEESEYNETLDKARALMNALRH